MSKPMPIVRAVAGLLCGFGIIVSSHVAGSSKLSAQPVSAAPQADAAQRYIGRWSGTMMRGGSREPLELHMVAPDQAEGGTFSWRGLGYVNAPILGSKLLDDGRLRVSLPLPLGALRLILVRDGPKLRGVLDESQQVAGEFKWLGENGTVELAQTRAFQPPPENEAVSFGSEGAVLKGTLHLPKGRGPFPAAVFVHGSGDVDRSDANLLAERLTAKGIAVLAYDKRGVGESTGDWKTGSLQLLAADARAAHQWLSRHRKIDGNRVGYVGRSQGGWIAPLAMRSGGAAFAAFISGPSVSPADEDVDHYSHIFREAGMSETEFAQAEALLRLHHGRMQGRITKAELDAAADKHKGAPWFRLLHWDDLQSNVSDFDRSWIGYDPQADLKAIDVPTLWVYGSEDRVIPVEGSIVSLLRLKMPARPTIHVVPGGDHALARIQYPALPGGVPAAFDLIADWIATTRPRTR